MKKKYFILAFTFLFLLVGQSSLGQEIGTPDCIDCEYQDPTPPVDPVGDDLDPSDLEPHEDPLPEAPGVPDDPWGDSGDDPWGDSGDDPWGDSGGDSSDNPWGDGSDDPWGDLGGNPWGAPDNDSGNGNTGDGGVCDETSGSYDYIACHYPGGTGGGSNSGPGGGSGGSGSSGGGGGSGGGSGETCKGCDPNDKDQILEDVENVENIENVSDIFSPAGQPYGKTDSSGNVTILSSNGTYKKPSELNPDSPLDRKHLHKYASYLARGLDGMNKRISIGSDERNKLSSENPAATVYPVTVGSVSNANLIYLNTNGGYSERLDNINSFKHILKHEILHAVNNINGVTSTLSNHADVYINSMIDPSFKDSKKDFKISTIRSLVNYILNLDQRSELNYTVQDVKNKINALNNITGLGFSFITEPIDYNNKGTLTGVTIRDLENMNSIVTHPPYKPLTDEE